VNDREQEEINCLMKAMRDLVEESRRLAKRHEEITREYDRLRQALEQGAGEKVRQGEFVKPPLRLNGLPKPGILR
jgi:hypothetical protein